MINRTLISSFAALLVISLTSFANSANSNDPCATAAKKAAVAQVRTQDLFTNFDPGHPGSAVIRSVSTQVEHLGSAYTINIKYGLPGCQNTDVAESFACYVLTHKSGLSCFAAAADVSCGLQ